MLQSESWPGKATVGEWQDRWGLHTIQGGHRPAWGMENVCALLYQPDVLIFGEFIVNRFLFNCWGKRKVILTRPSSRCCQHSREGLQARWCRTPCRSRRPRASGTSWKEKNISWKLGSLNKDRNLPFPRRSPSDRSRHEWSCLLRLAQRLCSKQGRGIWSTWCNHKLLLQLLFPLLCYKYLKHNHICGLEDRHQCHHYILLSVPNSLIMGIIIHNYNSLLREHCSISHFPSSSVLCRRRFDL